MEHKFSKTEKKFIAIWNWDNYKAFICPNHGLYGKSENNENTSCPRCKTQGEEIENIKELQEQYKK